MTPQRTIPPYDADERATLTAFLDFQRATLAVKCDGLTGSELRERAVPPSSLWPCCQPGRAGCYLQAHADRPS